VDDAAGVPMAIASRLTLNESSAIVVPQAMRNGAIILGRNYSGFNPSSL
jgi:hypothetical protein